jgi:putative phage-type endonuclease
MNNILSDDISTLLHLFYDYIILNPTSISDPNFEENMLDDIFELLSNIDEEYIDDLLDISLPIFYDCLYTKRSEDNICFQKNNLEKENIKHKLERINNIVQPQQKSPEWYYIRQNLITASNAYKIFESVCQQNSLIYEKCKSKSIDEFSSKQAVNINSSLHWGQKYEQISVLLYEDMYQTKIGEYGCIQHQTYSFIGASPDGINIDPSSNRFGRMLEIKNIVNREITGIPKKEYWIQMQFQMEVFDLQECDFLETRFIEYETELDFFRDTNDFIFLSKNGEKKGIILFFSDETSGKPIYIYSPFFISLQEYDEWSEQIIEKTLNDNPSFIWVKQIYWKLDEISCVLVKRNKKWFQDVLPMIENFWEIIQREKIEGYEHRAPKTRNKIIH